MRPLRRVLCKGAIISIVLIVIISSGLNVNKNSWIEIQPIKSFQVAATPVSEWLLVESFDNTIDDGWTEVGTTPYLDYQDQPTNYIYCTSGPGAGNSHGNYDFFATSADDSVTDVNVTIYHNTNERTRVTIYNSTTSDTIDFANSGGGWASETITQTSGGEELEVFWSSKTELDAAYVVVNAKSQGGAGQVSVDEVKIGVTGTEVSGVAYDVTVYELIDLSDSTDTEINLSMTVSESLPLYDSTDTAVSLVTTIYEIISLFDVVTAEILGGGIDYFVTIYEILPFSESVSTVWNAFLEISEIIPLDDTIDTAWSAVLEIFEVIDLFDSVTAIVNPAITVMIYAIIPIGESGIVEGGQEGLNIFYDVFMSDNSWSYLGPAALVIMGFFLMKKDRGLAVIWFIVECLFIYQYTTLVSANPAYWWHIYILLFGALFTVVFPLWERR